MSALIKKEVRTKAAPAPKPFYSQGVVVGNMVYISGSLGIDPPTGKLVEGSIGARTVWFPTLMPFILWSTDIHAGTDSQEYV